jgi:MFS family permease
LFTHAFALFAERRYTWNDKPFGPHEVGLVYVYVGVIGVFLQGGLLGRLVKRFGDRRLVTVGFFLAGCGYIALGHSFSITSLLIIAAVASVGNGILRPCLTSEVTQASPAGEQGVVLGIGQSLGSIAAVIAPPLANGLIGQGWLLAWALTAAAVSLIGFSASLRLKHTAS